VASRGAVVAVRTQHPHELADDVALGELGDRRKRGVGARVLDDREMARSQRGYLWKVRDAEDLAVAGDLAKPRATARAVCPPIPASTSSNTSVAPGAEAPAALMIASITRESSPPRRSREAGLRARRGSVR